MGNLQYRFFADVDLNDPFFDSLTRNLQTGSGVRRKSLLMYFTEKKV